MKKFCVRAVFYLLPLFIGVLIIWIVDPYRIFEKSGEFDEKKFEIGYGFDQGRRYKIFTYLNSPTDKIILGASEINIINERNIPEKGWHSLSYGGAPLQESLNMYWEIRKDHSLSKVIIAPEFIKYYLALSSEYSNHYYSNFNWANSQSEKAFEIYKKKYLYFIDKYTIKSTLKYLVNMFMDQEHLGKPQGTKKDFWREQLDYAKKVYAEDVYGSNKKNEIKELLESIKQDAGDITKIMIVIPIQHIDLLKLEFEESVYRTYQDYIHMLVDIFGYVHYFAYTEDVSEDDSLFTDPFHCINDSVYISQLFKGNSHFVINQNNIDNSLEMIRNRVMEK